MDEHLEDPEAESIQSGKIVVCWYCDEDKVNSDTIKRVQIQASTLQIGRAILIVKENSSMAKKEEKDSLITLEIFTLDDLQVNITQHVLVPKHSVLSDD